MVYVCIRIAYHSTSALFIFVCIIPFCLNLNRHAHLKPLNVNAPRHSDGFSTFIPIFFLISSHTLPPPRFVVSYVFILFVFLLIRFGCYSHRSEKLTRTKVECVLKMSGIFDEKSIISKFSCEYEFFTIQCVIPHYCDANLIQFMRTLVFVHCAAFHVCACFLCDLCLFIYFKNNLLEWTNGQ